jgi:hypothetical protein
MALATCVATMVEKRRPLRVDTMIPDPLFTSTHAITIDAAPEQVWPWIAPMGAGRGGWYSWDAINNGGTPSAARVSPDLQAVEPGDIMPAVPGATDAVVVSAVEPPRDLVLTVPDGHGGRGIQRRSTAPGQHGASAEGWRRFLLICGILASVLYVAMTLLVGLLWEDYSIVSGVPSELSAIGAPTRQLWMWLGGVYAVLMVGFGWIVWKSAPPNRALRVVGALLMAHTVFGQFWPPMHQRAVLAAGGGTLTDTLHLAWAAITGVFFMLIVGFGAAALGKRFRVYSIATIVIVLACGAVTGTYASQVQADLPTPGVGVWERISIATFMAWIAVLATALLRAPHNGTTPDRRSGSGTRP